jgi:hypothetical protein
MSSLEEDQYIARLLESLEDSNSGPNFSASRSLMSNSPVPLAPPFPSQDRQQSKGIREERWTSNTISKSYYEPKDDAGVSVPLNTPNPSHSVVFPPPPPKTLLEGGLQDVKERDYDQDFNPSLYHHRVPGNDTPAAASPSRDWESGKGMDLHSSVTPPSPMDDFLSTISHVYSPPYDLSSTSSASSSSMKTTTTHSSFFSSRYRSYDDNGLLAAGYQVGDYTTHSPAFTPNTQANNLNAPALPSSMKPLPSSWAEVFREKSLSATERGEGAMHFFPSGPTASSASVGYGLASSTGYRGKMGASVSSMPFLKGGGLVDESGAVTGVRTSTPSLSFAGSPPSWSPRRVMRRDPLSSSRLMADSLFDDEDDCDLHDGFTSRCDLGMAGGGGEGSFVWIPNHQDNCRTWQRKIEHDPSLVAKNVDAILCSVDEMILDNFGNYLLQTIIQSVQGDAYFLYDVASQIKSNMHSICVDPRGSRCVQCLIDNCKKGEEGGAKTLQLIWVSIQSIGKESSLRAAPTALSSASTHPIQYSISYLLPYQPSSSASTLTVTMSSRGACRT